MSEENITECASDNETMETHEILRESFKVPMSKALAKSKKKRLYTTKIYKCDVCGKQTEDKSVHRNHIQIHSDEKAYQCTQCPNNFKTKKYLSRHVKRVHTDSKKLECEQCGKKYQFNTQLKAHKMIHTGEKPLKCKVCDKGFRVHYSLKTHMLIHSDEKPFSCSFCAYSCRDSSTLRKHQHRHMDLDKTYQCRTCLVVLRLKSQLKLHIAERHLGLDVRVFKCDLCGKGYKVKAVLAKHIQIIHGRKPAPAPEPPDDDEDDDYKPKKKKHVRHFRAQCAVCERVFDRRTRYEQHVTRHRVNRSVKCEHCQMCFLDASYLSLHMRRAHGGALATFECAACAHVCLSRAEMRAHLRSAHPDPEGGGHKAEGNDPAGGTAGGAHEAGGARKAGGECGDCGRRFRTAAHLARHRAARHPAPPQPPELMVDIKQEPLETEDAFAELDLFEVEKQEIEDHVRAAALSEARAQIAQQLASLRRVPERLFDEHFIDTVNKREIDVSVRNDLNEKIRKSMPLSTDNVLNDNQSHTLSEQVSSAVPAEAARSKPKKKHKAAHKEKKTLKVKKKKKRKMELQLGADSEAGVGDELGVEAADVARGEETEARGEGAEARGEVLEAGGEVLEAVGEAEGRKRFKKIKLKIDLKQCNVCLKVFKTKPELLEHCREHFDVCTERTLKKCPRCEFVTSGDLRRHLRLVHRLDVPMAHVLQETRGADGTSYSYRLASAEVPRVEVVPSVARLHQLAGVRPTTLVRRGPDWAVRPAFRDDDLIAAGVVAADSHVDKLKKLHRLSKRRAPGEAMLFPCDSCAKVCRTASGLVLHRRRHDPHAKPFKPKVWKHKLSAQQLAALGRREPQPKTVDTLQPRPILSARHRCDPKLRDFYMNNIRGGDIEFWQFLKIFNKIARDNVNDFSDLEQKEEFAMHRVLSPRDPPAPAAPAPAAPAPAAPAPAAPAPAAPAPAAPAPAAPAPTTAAEPKAKFTRVVRLSKQEHLRRKALKEKMREKIKAENEVKAPLLEC